MVFTVIATAIAMLWLVCVNVACTLSPQVCSRETETKVVLLFTANLFRMTSFGLQVPGLLRCT